MFFTNSQMPLLAWNPLSSFYTASFYSSSWRYNVIARHLSNPHPFYLHGISVSFHVFTYTHIQLTTCFPVQPQCLSVKYEATYGLFGQGTFISFVLFTFLKSFFFKWRCDPTWVMPPRSWGFLRHMQRRTTDGRTPLDEWSSRRRDLYLTTHNTHNRQNIHAPGGIRTHDLSRRAAADLRLRPCGHWDSLFKIIFHTV